MALYNKEDLAAKTLAELKTLADDHGIEFDDKPTKVVVIRELMKLTAEDALIEDDDDEIDDDEEVDDEADEEVDDEEVDDDELDDEELDDEEIDEIVAKPAAKKTTSAAKPAATKRVAKVKTEGEGETLAAKQVASILGTEAKTLRQFFRSAAWAHEPVGSGGRYEFAESDVPEVKEAFDAWRAGHAARGASRTAGKKGSTPSKAVAIEEVEEIEELELDDELDDDDEIDE